VPHRPSEVPSFQLLLYCMERVGELDFGAVQRQNERHADGGDRGKDERESNLIAWKGTNARGCHSCRF
jgi:hypothetical protein